MFLHALMYTNRSWCACGGQRSIPESVLSFHHVDPGVKFRSPGSAVSVFTHPAISLALGHFEQKIFIKFFTFVYCMHCGGMVSVGCM